MKKITLIILFFTVTSYAQQTFDLIKSLKNDKIIELNNKLKQDLNYHNETDKLLINNLRLFLNNPFDDTIENFNLIESIKKLNLTQPHVSLGNIAKGTKINEVSKSYFSTELSKEITKNIIPVSSSIASGFSPTTQIIDATSKLLVERTKQELTLTFYQNFKDKFDDPIKIELEDKTKINIQLNQIFPNTYLLFESQNYFQTPSFGQVWTTSFKKDIQNFPAFFRNLINENLKQTNKGHFALVSFDLVSQLYNGNNPKIILDNLSLDYTSYDSREIDKIIALLSVLSNNLTTNIDGENNEKLEYWIKSSDFKSLDEEQLKLLTGLVYQKIKDEKLLNNTELNLISKNYKTLTNFINKTQGSFTLIETKLKSLKENANKEQELKLFSEYLNTFYKIFDESYESYYKMINSDYYKSKYYEEYRSLAYDIIDFNTATNTKNYAECILISTHFFTNLIPKTGENNKIIKDINFYGSFMLDISNTIDNKGELKPVLEHYILPVTSYRIKRQFNSSWDVSAYPGLYLGYEFSGSNSLSYGITAPIGISYSFKSNNFNNIDKSSSSKSFFFSVIDIGAPFSYRFTNDEAQGLPEDIKWEQIFSPGLFYIYGLKNSPLSLGLNIQFTPLLRKIDDDSNQLNDKNIIRAGFVLLVDIPLFNLLKIENHLNFIQKCNQKNEAKKNKTTPNR